MILAKKEAVKPDIGLRIQLWASQIIISVCMVVYIFWYLNMNNIESKACVSLRCWPLSRWVNGWVWECEGVNESVKWLQWWWDRLHAVEYERNKNTLVNTEHIPTQFGKLIFHVLRDVQANSLAFDKVSGKTWFKSHKNFKVLFVLNTRRARSGAAGSMHPRAGLWLCLSFYVQKRRNGNRFIQK